MGLGSFLRIGKLLQGMKAAAPAANNIVATQASRKAGEELLKKAAFDKGFGKLVFGDMAGDEIAMRLAPDVLFGGMAAVQTPGDIGDKILAGGTQLVGGGLGGLALARGAGAMGAGSGLQTMADFAGSIGGDYAGMYAGDALQRAKDKLTGGEGLTAFERMSKKDQEAFAEQIRMQTLMGAGLIPGVQQQYGYM